MTSAPKSPERFVVIALYTFIFKNLVTQSSNSKGDRLSIWFIPVDSNASFNVFSFFFLISM